jgi:hypothetical protein
MKKNLFIISILALGLGFASCSDSDSNNDSDKTITEDEAQNLDYTSDNAAAWGNYAVNVVRLLANDSKNLYDEWNKSFAAAFKGHTASSGYNTAIECVQEIIAGSIDIATEVGTAKIGEPVGYWNDGQRNKALYAVESWYSYHSREDYMNNILSVANSIIGANINIENNVPLTDSYKDLANANSIYAKGLQSETLSPLVEDVWQKIVAAHNAIWQIPQPFRNNINSAKAVVAMDACAQLTASLETLNASIEKGSLSEDDAQAIVNQWVDVVVLPTYKDLVDKNNVLQTAVNNLQKSPSNATFEAACSAWIAARKPWESSAAFLFGPVAEMGLDPNMDSWPLDAVGIANLLKSQRWSDMEWTGRYEEPDEDNPSARAEAIEAAQSLRGFHTLEYLLFKNGAPRTVK